MGAGWAMRAAWLAVGLGIASTSGCANVLGLRESLDDGDCVLNSDCAPGKACIFRVCSPQCQADKDCPTTQRCLRTSNGEACVDSHGAGCDKTCPQGTICDTTQNVCRNGCNLDADCLGGQVCTNQVCRGSDTGHDPTTIDAGGARDSSVDATGGGGRGGAAGSAGAAGSGGNAGTAGSGASGGNAGTSAGGNGGAGGTAGGGSTDAAGGAGGAGTAGSGGAAGTVGSGGTVGTGGAVGTGGTSGGGGGGGGTGGTVVTDGSTTDAPRDAAPDRCAPECTLGDTRCGISQGVQTCTSVDGCLVWGTEVPCGGRKVCAGSAPTAACVCAPRPSGCENGKGTFCSDATTLVECAEDADKCIYKLTPVTCPVGKPCTGSHPTASCSCATPPTACNGQQGAFCESSTVVARCGLDGANCLAIVDRVTCPTGKPCTGAFGSASCSCNAPPADCGGGAGHACRGAPPGEVVNCDINTDGCVVITSTTACTAGKPCAGAPPSSACTCPTPPAGCNQAGSNFCQSPTSIGTCGFDGDGCLNVTGTSSCPPAKPCVSGVCTCPTPPAICSGIGYFCSNSDTLVHCANDANGCLGIESTVSCGGGKQCTGAAGSAACICLPPPTDCPTGTGGTVCRPGNVLATCAQDPMTGCVVTTGTTACIAGNYCVGSYPTADCSGICLAGTVACASTASIHTCTSSGQWGTPSSCPLPTPPNPVCANGKCAYRAGFGQPGNSTNTLASGFIYAIRFQVSVAATAYRVGMFGTATGNSVRMAIYEGNSLEPLARLGLTSNFASTSVQGSMEADLGGPLQLQTAKYYWIAAIGNANVGMYVTANGAGYFLSTNPSGWNILMDPFPSGGSMNFEMTPNFYVVLQDQ